MAFNTDDLRIRGIREAVTALAPDAANFLHRKASSTVFRAREEIHRIMHRGDSCLLAIVGPCSIHDYDAAIDYAKRLQALRLTMEPD